MPLTVRQARKLGINRTPEELAYAALNFAAWPVVSQHTESPKDRAKIVAELRKALRAYSTAARTAAS